LKNSVGCILWGMVEKHAWIHHRSHAWYHSVDMWYRVMCLQSSNFIRNCYLYDLWLTTHLSCWKWWCSARLYFFSCKLEITIKGAVITLKLAWLGRIDWGMVHTHTTWTMDNQVYTFTKGLWTTSPGFYHTLVRFLIDSQKW